MDSSTPSHRARGIQALRAGDLDQAIDLLARAVIADGRDGEAQAFLGVAYSQKGLHAQATRALQTAVDLEPRSAGHWYNLGIALERAGDLPGAAVAYGETLRINPVHGPAQARRRALGPSARGRGSTPVTPPWLRGRDAPSTAAQTGTPRTAYCPKCRQWSKPGISCEWCSGVLNRAPAAPTAPRPLSLSRPLAATPAPRQLSSSRPPAAGGVSRIAASAAPAGMSPGEAFHRRWLASLIDGLICCALSFAVGLVLGALMGAASGPGSEARNKPLSLSPAQVLGIAGRLALSYAYYVGMLGACGQTLGKRAMALRVTGPDGEKPSFGRAALRETIGKLVSLPVFCLGCLWMLWDSEQQTWHDKLAGTHVLRTGCEQR
jgi:uncharacterized RDD family membrane protein YckC